MSIAIRDVLRYLVAAVDLPPEVSRVLEIGGPEVLTYQEMMQRYAAVAGLALAGGPRDEGHLERWLLAPIRASMWATLTTAPLTLFWFGQIAPWTVVLTPLLAPLVKSVTHCCSASPPAKCSAKTSRSSFSCSTCRKPSKPSRA